jgi:hypothetical protein
LMLKVRGRTFEKIVGVHCVTHVSIYVFSNLLALVKNKRYRAEEKRSQHMNI